MAHLPERMQEAELIFLAHSPDSSLAEKEEEVALRCSHTHMESQNDLGCGGPLKVVCSKPLAVSRHILNQSRLLRALSNRISKVSRNEESTTSLGSLFQCLTTFLVKKSIPCIWCESALFCLKSRSPYPIGYIQKSVPTSLISTLKC